MKLKENLVLRKVARNWVVIPVAERTLDFSGILSLNDSGAMLWNLLKDGTDRNAMVRTLTETYDVSERIAANDVDTFIEKLIKAGCIEE